MFRIKATDFTYICITVTHGGEFGTESIDIKPCAITKTCINAKGHLGRADQSSRHATKCCKHPAGTEKETEHYVKRVCLLF